MQQGAYTKELKDVFRELDGFLVLTSVLSSAYAGQETTVAPPEEVAATIECARLVFMIFSDALYDHSENSEYFDVRIGQCRLFLSIASYSFISPSLPFLSHLIYTF
jgi:hypothetical protein